MFNSFLIKLRPFMDADSGAGMGAAASQSSEGSTSSGESQSSSETGSSGAQSAPNTSNTDPASQKQAQTPEQNAAFAEMRRKSEAAEKKAQEAEAARQRDVGIAKKYGKDYGVYSEADIAEKYGHQGIKTMADFENAVQQQAAKDAGIDPNLVRQLAQSDPEFIELKQFVSQMKQQQTVSQLNSEISELASEYPDLKVKTLDDIAKLPNATAILAKAQKGYSFLDAYEAINREEIRNQAREQGSQQAIRNIGSKSHLGTEKSGNQPHGKEVELTPEQMRVWTAMGYSEAEARKRAAKYIKK